MLYLDDRNFARCQVVGLTKRVATRQLRFLSIARSQLISNTVEELDVALLWSLLESCDEGP